MAYFGQYRSCLGNILTAFRDYWKIAAFSVVIILLCALASVGASYIFSRKSAQTAVTNAIPPARIAIEGARTPCLAHSMHVFGYVLDVTLNQKREAGAVCWDIFKQRWEWTFVSDSLRHLNSDPNRI